MSEGPTPSPANLYPPTPEQELRDLVFVQLMACRNKDEEFLSSLQAEGKEGLRMEVPRYVCLDSDERYIPSGPGAPSTYEMLVWKPNPAKSFGIHRIVTRIPLYEPGPDSFFWPNDVLIAVEGDLRDRQEEKILLNGFGLVAYERPEQLEPNSAEGADSLELSQNLFRLKEGVSVVPRFTAEEMLFILQNSETQLQSPTNAS